MSKEGDKILWRGVRPTAPESIFTRLEKPDGCTHVQFNGIGAAGLATIYTVGADVSFYLTDWTASMVATVGASGGAQIRDFGGGALFDLCWLYTAPSIGLFAHHTYATAIRMSTGQYIRITSGDAGNSLYFMGVGYTRPV